MVVRHSLYTLCKKFYMDTKKNITLRVWALVEGEFFYFYSFIILELVEPVMYGKSYASESLPHLYDPYKYNGKKRRTFHSTIHLDSFLLTPEAYIHYTHSICTTHNKYTFMKFKDQRKVEDILIRCVIWKFTIQIGDKEHFWKNRDKRKEKSW